MLLKGGPMFSNLLKQSSFKVDVLGSLRSIVKANYSHTRITVWGWIEPASDDQIHIVLKYLIA